MFVLSPWGVDKCWLLCFRVINQCRNNYFWNIGFTPKFCDENRFFWRSAVWFPTILYIKQMWQSNSALIDVRNISNNKITLLSAKKAYNIYASVFSDAIEDVCIWSRFSNIIQISYNVNTINALVTIWKRSVEKIRGLGCFR